MKTTILTVSFNTEKLDALTYHMGKKQATREYLDDKIAREESAKERPRRPARPAPAAVSTEEAT